MSNLSPFICVCVLLFSPLLSNTFFLIFGLLSIFLVFLYLLAVSPSSSITNRASVSSFAQLERILDDTPKSLTDSSAPSQQSPISPTSSSSSFYSLVDQCALQSFDASINRVNSRHDSWWPNESHQHQRDRVHRLATALGGKWIHFVGDSTIRMIYFEFANLFHHPSEFGRVITDARLANARKVLSHETIVHLSPSGSSRRSSFKISFERAPFVSNVTTALRSILFERQRSTSPASTTIGSPIETVPDMIFSSAGLWNLLYDHPLIRDDHVSDDDYIQSFEQDSRSFATQLRTNGLQEWTMGAWKARMKPNTMQHKGTSISPSSSSPLSEPVVDNDTVYSDSTMARDSVGRLQPDSWHGIQDWQERRLEYKQKEARWRMMRASMMEWTKVCLC